MLWTECSFPYAQWCQKDQTIRDLQSAVADRGIQKCTNTAWDLRKPWMSRVALNGKQIPKKFILALVEKREKKHEFMVHVQFEARSQVPVLHPTSGCRRDTVQWMARETAPSWISPLQGSGGVVFSQWYSETARMETGKAKYLCPNPSSLCYITSQLC